MDDHPLAAFEPDERTLLAIFARYGRDGRALTTTSLAVHAGFAGEHQRVSRAIRRLLARGIIKEAGGDPFVSSPPAYRLAYRIGPRTSTSSRSNEK